ncbi:hypothetical protein RHGRI_026194 [Rhododendron griersonianum]|uniref:Uncharacterized protein n=1 Tax=Rhododendron griersonianum TaxID=479676 RepID=A0AAV6IRZ1_9ERIC|nr:hypothetical protein RHGRI_026194 [Rhododendron griersonianum]
MCEYHDLHTDLNRNRETTGSLVRISITRSQGKSSEGIRCDIVLRRLIQVNSQLLG